MTGGEKAKIQITLKVWGQQATERNELPVLMLAITEDCQKGGLYGTENFPSQQHLITFLQDIIDQIRKID